MKIAVIGSRSFQSYELLSSSLNSVGGVSLIVSGGAKGADLLAERYAFAHNIPTLIYKPDWKKYGRGAGVVRNKQILDAADMIVAFWDCVSKGTKNSIDTAKKMNKEVRIVEFRRNISRPV